MINVKDCLLTKDAMSPLIECSKGIELYIICIVVMFCSGKCFQVMQLGSLWHENNTYVIIGSIDLYFKGVMQIRKRNHLH
jgi:hypothetical protein